MRSLILWLVAVLITVFSAVWQRATGPAHPYRGEIEIGGQRVSFSLPRSHAGPGDQVIRVEVPDTAVTGRLVWRRYPTSDPWVQQEMRRDGTYLVGQLPHQPPAGKLEYEIQLRHQGETVLLSERPIVIRFRGYVPEPVLVTHILAMFLFMLFANRSGLEALAGAEAARRYGLIAFALLVVGGFILGPMVQKFAFGEWWTGVPYGHDLTDNKTLIAGLVWLWALLRSRGGRPARGAFLFAAAVTLVVFLIPHSVWGSELKWEELPEGNP